MNNPYLNRAAAPVGEKTWELLDRAMIGAAKSQLVARRFIALEGPFGAGVKAIPLADVKHESGSITAPCLPLQQIFRPFEMAVRDIAAYERDGLFLDANAVAMAAIRCAEAEEELIYTGSPETPGLLDHKGVAHSVLSSWQQVGKAALDVIKAVTILDNAGFHGPYALALGAERYNQLLRLYPDGSGTEIEHVQKIVTGGVYKAAALKTRGVLLATGSQFTAIMMGQDMSTGFVCPKGERLEFSVSEALGLHIREPKAICALKPNA